jgi:hypothetical protein
MLVSESVCLVVEFTHRIWMTNGTIMRVQLFSDKLRFDDADEFFEESELKPGIGLDGGDENHRCHQEGDEFYEEIELKPDVKLDDKHKKAEGFAKQLGRFQS